MGGFPCLVHHSGQVILDRIQVHRVWPRSDDQPRHRGARATPLHGDL